jgi:RNA polymerase sigma-70 factor, ECF subfamily
MAGDGDGEREGGLKGERRRRLAALVGIRQALTPDEAKEFWEVFPALHEAHFPQVCTQLGRRTLDWATVEDLAQESFEEIREEIIEKGFPDEMEAYVFTITQGKLLNYLAWQKRSPFSVGLPSSGSEPPRTGPEMEREMDLSAFRERLCEELSEDHLRIAELCLLNKLKIREAAVVLGIPEGTVSSRLRRVREVIGTLINRWIPPSQRK